MKVLICRPLEEAGFVNGFSTRVGGVSDFPNNALNLSGLDIDSAANLAENRRRFLDVLGGDFPIASAWQTHGANVKIVENLREVEDDGRKYDALISDLEKVLVGVKTADCVPILIGDPQTKAFAAIHAGWRGTAVSIVVRATEKLREVYGVKTENLICAIGAAATGKNYEVGTDVIEIFTSNFADGAELFTATRDGHALIDLHRANKNQLESVGIAPENIFTAPFCTMERTDLFFSYRVESRIYQKTGRLLSVIGLKN
ncbi:MAG: peptidoglycan editing factor PgeF [Acidobacteriota bacterium]|nr:peptidoglycan editing factor PgeF [Acidobacteriota bacterium]